MFPGQNAFQIPSGMFPGCFRECFWIRKMFPNSFRIPSRILTFLYTCVQKCQNSDISLHWCTEMSEFWHFSTGHVFLETSSETNSIRTQGPNSTLDSQNPETQFKLKSIFHSGGKLKLNSNWTPWFLCPNPANSMWTQFKLYYCCFHTLQTQFELKFNSNKTQWVLFPHPANSIWTQFKLNFGKNGKDASARRDYFALLFMILRHQKRP